MNAEVLNQILDHSLSMACDQLEKDGHFYPFSFVMDQKGELMRSGDLSDEEKAGDPEAIIVQMHAMLASGCSQKIHKAIAVITDVKVERFKSEGFVRAVEVRLEYEDGSGFDCYLPYRESEGSIHYGSLFHTSFDSKKFTSSK